MSQLSYAGVVLPIDTPDVRSWMGRTVPLEELRALGVDRTWPGTNLTGLTWPYATPAAWPPRIGSWWYPTGAGRFGTFWGVIGQDQYDQIVPAAFTAGGPTPQTFTMAGDAATVSTSMYLLPPRPLARTGDGTALYLVCLVDDRYFFQLKDASLALTDSSTWTSVIAGLAAALGVTVSLTSAVESAYGQPHPQSDLLARYENAAQLLDAVLWCVGRTLVRELDGTYAAQRFSEAKAVSLANQTGLLMAGGDSTAVLLTSGDANLTPDVLLPASVTVTFPKRLQATGGYVNAPWSHLPYPRTAGDLQAYTVSLSAAGYGQYAGSPGGKTLHDTAEAWLVNPGDATPVNDPQLSALATQLAADYYAWATEGLDAVYPGVHAWTPEGIHDLLWEWTCDRCRTRVMRRPWNTGVEEVLHHFPGSGSGSGPGCGLKWSNGILSVDPSALAGDGLVTGTGCTLNVNPGCGVKVVADQVEVDNAALAGTASATGLVPTGTCGLSVDLAVAGTTTINPVTSEVISGSGCTVTLEQTVTPVSIRRDAAGILIGVSTGTPVVTSQSVSLSCRPGPNPSPCGSPLTTCVPFVSSVACVNGSLQVTQKYLIWDPTGFYVCDSCGSGSGSGGGGGGGGGGGSRTLACCPGLLLPDTLYGTVSGSCSCLPASFPLTYSATGSSAAGCAYDEAGWYSAAFSCGGNLLQFALFADAEAPCTLHACCGSVDTDVSSGTCTNPVMLVFDFEGLLESLGCCGGTATITLTA